MKRRNLVLAGAVGTAAAVAGIGAAWWRLRPEELPLPSGFWQTRFEKPEGGELVLANYRGKPLVLNFWATWCPPCVKEMPDLDTFAKEHATQGWRVLGLAVDNPKAVREFLARAPVGYTIGLAGFEGSDLARQLGNGQGGGQAGLPFTVAFDRNGAVTHRKSGATTLEELRGWAKKA